MTLKTFSALLLLSSAGALVACGGTDGATDGSDGDDVSEAEAVSAKVTPGSFKLYAQPQTVPSPGCDVHTHLALAANGTAALEERVGGMCMIAVMPDPRTYRIRLVDTQCGSRIYTGKLTQQGKTSTIKITDHRSRMCMDAIPSQVIVEETRNGATTKKYGNAEAAPAQVETITGQLVRSYGIGGENTGTSIKDANGLTELVLDAGERNQFVEGKRARVTGVVTYLSGVETHDRKALDVSEMLVCPNPGWINCMPGPNVRLSNLCASENRSWVQANCPGVDYAD